ncbi:MAG: hypothetical protein AMXMBFR13_06800 [Phycisphaerae bacterium]
MKATVLSAILEVRARRRPRPGEQAPEHTRYDLDAKYKALRQLRRSRLAGRDVLAVIDDRSGDDKTWVPHFAYDGHHEGPLWQSGVWRYFGVSIAIEGEVDLLDVLTTYEVGADARLCVCGRLGKEDEHKPRQDCPVVADEWDEYKLAIAQRTTMAGSSKHE